MSNRPTPISDANEREAYLVEGGYMHPHRQKVVLSDQFRRIEQMCWELADMLALEAGYADAFHRSNGVGAKKALAKWETMRKECGG